MFIDEFNELAALANNLPQQAGALREQLTQLANRANALTDHHVARETPGGTTLVWEIIALHQARGTLDTSAYADGEEASAWAAGWFLGRWPLNELQAERDCLVALATDEGCLPPTYAAVVGS